MTSVSEAHRSSGLRQFPVDALKIDRSLVREMQNDRGACDMVEVIITLAHKMNLPVIAQGIETARQLERLGELGCEFGQGYYFSPSLWKRRPPRSFCDSRLRRHRRVERQSRREELKTISKQVKVKVVSNYHGRPSLCNRRAVQRSLGCKETAPPNEQLRYMAPVHSSFNPPKAGPWLRMTRFAVAAEKVRPT